MDERQDYVFYQIKDKNAEILELGPLNRPIVDKGMFCNAVTADIRSTEEVKELYGKQNEYLKSTGIVVDIESIVDVDYVIKGTYKETFRDHAKFDYIIASHVIEHIPDLLGWFNETYEVLNRNGKLIIVYPDRRYTFDHYRNDSVFSQIYLASQHSKQIIHERILDFKINVINENSPYYWWENSITLEHLPQNPTNVGGDMGSMDDVHYWPFSPYGFIKFLYDMELAGLSSFRCVDFQTTSKNSQQFFITLEKKDGSEVRSELLNELKGYLEQCVLSEDLPVQICEEKYEREKNLSASYKKEILRTSAMLDQKEIQIQQIKTELTNCMSSEKRMEDVATEYREEIVRISSLLEQKEQYIKQLREEIQENVEEEETSERNVSEYRAEIERISSVLGQKEQHIEQLKKEIQENAAEGEAAERTISEYKAEIMRISSVLEQKEQCIEQLGKEIQENAAEGEAAERTISEYKAEIERISSVLEQKEQCIEQLKKEMQKNVAAGEAAERIISEYKTEITRVSNLLNQKEECIDQLEVEMGRIAVEREKAEKTVSEYQMEIARVSALLNEREQVIEQLKSELQVCSAKPETTEAEIIAHENVNDQL